MPEFASCAMRHMEVPEGVRSCGRMFEGVAVTASGWLRRIGGLRDWMVATEGSPWYVVCAVCCQ